MLFILINNIIIIDIEFTFFSIITKPLNKYFGFLLINKLKAGKHNI